MADNNVPVGPKCEGVSALCSKSVATAAAFFDTLVWRKCVRARSHNGACVYDKSDRELIMESELVVRLAEIDSTVLQLGIEKARLSDLLRVIRERAASADAHRGR